MSTAVNFHELQARNAHWQYTDAVTNFALGTREEGYNGLTKSFQNRGFELVVTKVDPRFDPLRGDSRFRKLGTQLGL